MSATELRLVLLGCPGAGKGTQAKVLCERYGITHLSTGDCFRAEGAAGTALGKKVADYMKRGVLVPDAVVNEVVASKLDALKGGWLLDGFPRTLDQAQELDRYLRANGQKLDLVLALAMKPEEIVRRLTSRRSCSCGEVYNLLSRPPRAEGVCDKCAKPLLQREDDTEATVRKRLMVYEDLTSPLVAYYRSGGVFTEVDGSLPVSDVTKGLCAAVDALAGSPSKS